jgi:hypothetical protein
MSNAYKCDNCGVLYEDNTTGFIVNENETDRISCLVKLYEDNTAGFSVNENETGRIPCLVKLYIKYDYDTDGECIDVDFCKKCKADVLKQVIYKLDPS